MLFRDSWVPFISNISYGGTMFNWGAILCTNINQAIMESQELGDDVSLDFFMSSFLQDVICASHFFPGLNQRFQLGEPPINVYCNILWENKYRTKYQWICAKLLIPFSHESLHPNCQSNLNTFWRISLIGMSLLMECIFTYLV